MERDIDVDVARWILEFLVQQPLEDRILTSLIAILPLTDENASLKRSLLLRRIESEIATTVSAYENILELLEQIEELDFKFNIKQPSDSLKAAYCSVAVACSVKFLENNGCDGKFALFDAVKRIWKERLHKMENAGRLGLVSEEFRSWAKAIEGAVWDDSKCAEVLKKTEGINVVEALRRYVKDEKDSMGPPFLELVAEAVRTDDRLKELLGIESRENVFASPSADRNLVRAGDAHQEVLKGNMSARKKVAASKRSRVALSGMSRGAKITDTDASAANLSYQMIKLPSTPEVNEVQEALKSSSLELKAVVKDPLPDALHVAGNVVSDVSGKDTTNVSQMHGGNNPPVAECSGAAQANRCDTDNHSHQHQNGAPKPSLMARNSTAHTVEWEDSIDTMTGDSPNHRNRACLPISKIQVVSPLRTHEPNSVKRRRKIKKWSLDEEATLSMGVETYGRGNWKVILNTYRDIFGDRTEVDLKDKWRNMTR